MKKRALATLMSTVMVVSLIAGCGDSTSGSASSATSTSSQTSSGSDFSGEDPKLTKHMKISTIWAEDNDNGVLINKIA